MTSVPADENDIAYDLGPMGDVESAILHVGASVPVPVGTASSPPMTVSLLVLTIYSAFKYIQQVHVILFFDVC